MLKQRLITGFVLILLLGAGIFFLPNTYFSTLFALFILVGAAEWSKLSNFNLWWQQITVIAIMAGIMIITWYTTNGMSNVSLWIFILTFIGWIAGFIWVTQASQSFKLNSVYFPIRIVVGCLVLIPCWIAISYLHGTYGPNFVFFIFLLTATADTGAYFVGRKWGRRKLAPLVSPGKSWEGVIGGLISVVLFSIVAGSYLLMLNARDIVMLLIVCIVVSVFSVIGDLLESVLKRQANVKDSGRLLPGHGGVLDRIDSLTAAAPIFLLGLMSLEIGL